MRRVTIRRRLAVVSLAIAIALVIPSAVAIRYVTINALAKEIDDSVLAIGAKISNPLNDYAQNLCKANLQEAPTQTRSETRNEAEALLSGAPGLSVQCFGRDNNLLRSYGPVQSAEPPKEDVSGITSTALYNAQIGKNWYRVLIIESTDGNKIRVMRDLAEQRELRDKLSVRISIIAIIAVFLSGVVSWLVARQESQSLVKLTNAVKKANEQDGFTLDDARLKGGEVIDLAQAFRGVFKALNRSIESQRQLVQDAGHELKTPLTSLRTNIGTILRHPNVDTETLSSIAAALDSESRELSRLVDEVVILATDTDESDNDESFDVLEMATAVATRFSKLEKRVVEVTGTSFEVSGRSTRLERATRNLLSNAAKFSPSDSKITVHIETGKICVRDYGIGVSVADRERIFNRFYRATEARSQPGSGLGLSIVSKVAEDLGGRAYYRTPDYGEGSMFCIELPVAQL